MHINKQDVCLTLTSGGCNALNLLLHGAAEVSGRVGVCAYDRLLGPTYASEQVPTDGELARWLANGTVSRHVADTLRLRSCSEIGPRLMFLDCSKIEIMLLPYGWPLH
jgi:hypothetical protein